MVTLVRDRTPEALVIWLSLGLALLALVAH